MEFMYLVFTRMPGESYRRRLRSLLLYLCYVFRALINSLVCWYPALVLPLSSRLALAVKNVVFKLLFSTGTAAE